MNGYGIKQEGLPSDQLVVPWAEAAKGVTVDPAAAFDTARTNAASSWLGLFGRPTTPEKLGGQK